MEFKANRIKISFHKKGLSFSKENQSDRTEVKEFYHLIDKRYLKIEDHIRETFCCGQPHSGFTLSFKGKTEFVDLQYKMQFQISGSVRELLMNLYDDFWRMFICKRNTTSKPVFEKYKKIIVLMENLHSSSSSSCTEYIKWQDLYKRRTQTGR